MKTQAAFRGNFLCSYSAPRRLPHHELPSSWKAHLQNFLPSPLQQNTPGVGPTAADHTINLTHLTVKSINQLLSKNEDVEAWHKAKQGSRCLAQRPSWIKLLPLHPWTRYPKSYRTLTRNWHLGSKSRFNCVPKFPTKQTPPYSQVPGKHFKEDGVCWCHRSTSSASQVMKGISCQGGPQGTQESQCHKCCKSHSDPCYPPPVKSTSQQLVHCT